MSEVATEPQSKTMSIRAYAKRRGCAMSAVQKAIRTGRITTNAGGKIDPAQADAAWEENTAPRPVTAARHRTSPPQPRRLSGPVAPEPALAGGGNYLVARGVREGFLARLAKIQYEEKLGKLLNRDEVQVERFNTNRIIRDGVLNIPDRVSAQLAAETDEKKVHEILTTEIRIALNGIADSLTNGN
jgi:hypothetical protein